MAEDAAALCREMGLDPVEVVRAEVRTSGAGLEADARSARYAAIEAAADRLGAVTVLSATPATTRPSRCCSASRAARAPARSAVCRCAADRFVRPLLALPRATTLAACAAYGIEPWDDPHNSDDSFRRVRARRLLATLESELGPGFAAALARSADLLREDADYLESLALTGPRGAARRDPAATASTSRPSRPCPGRSAPACGGCSPPRPAHRSPTSALRTSSRSTPC